MQVKDVLKSVVNATKGGALTEEKIRTDLQEFLTYFPRLKINALPRLEIRVAPIDGNGVYNGGGRVGLSPMLGEAERRRVLFHELMHWVHMEGPQGFKDAIRAHFEARTVGEKIRRLPGYRAETVGKKDDWYEAYAGRVYTGFEMRPQGLEVPTRYIEWLTMSPEKASVLWNDPKFQETMKIVLQALF